jgi:hypothetical protein
VQLTIENWYGWMPMVASTEQWHRWSEGMIVDSGESRIDLSSIPPMLRRRLSPMGRACASVLLPLIDSDNEAERANTPIVFASRHGEAQRTQLILEDIAECELISPTAFSLSVHNAISGILSINKKITANISAIAASGSEVMAVLFEAAGLLSQENCSKVHCVVVDNPLPDRYQRFCQQPQHPLALAFSVSNAQKGCKIELQSAECQTDEELQPLQFIRLLLGQKKSIQLSQGRAHWQLSRVC